MSRALGPIAHRISNLLARGSVAAANAASKMQALQVRLLAGEVKDSMEHFEPFGFTSKPLPGAEAITAFFDGDRSHGVVLVVADRRYRLRTLDDGEVALHDAYGNRAHFKKDGTFDIVATTKVAITSPLVTITGNLQVAGTITGTVDVVGGGKSLKTHTHSGVQAGASNTGQPN
ncbi:MAG: phage baseplate assembly protein V [Burkholderiales bacterium]|nr:MAG: phage baseplate assembly protein V [Burkholderiales bacterium]